MSKYKTPFPVEVESSKALQNRTSKYRLPFQKDEPIEDLHVTLNNLSQQNITLQSELKLPKLAMSTDLSNSQPRKHKSNLGTHEEVMMSVKSDKQQLHNSYIATSYEPKEIKNQPQEIKNQQKEKVESQRSKEEERPRPKLSIYSKKRRFLSSASKYADDEGNNADYTQQSEQDDHIRKEKGRRVQSELPTIGENKLSKVEKEDSDEDIKIWEDLSKEIEKYQENKEQQQLINHKIKQRHKNRKSLSKRKYRLEDDSIQIIQNELITSASKDRRQRRSQSLAENTAFYDLLKQQNQSPKNKMKAVSGSKQHLNLMEKLKQIIALRNERIKKQKVKLPLEFYINSYEQIKSINPFFRKLNQMEGCILLNIGKLAIFDANKIIYSHGDIVKDIYIIIYGKVLLCNKYKTLKKFAQTGQTLGEEELFENQKSYIQRLKEHSRPNIHKNDAKALNKTCLLRIKLQKYYKMSCELHRMGYKQQFNLIDNLFRINYINKQTNLHYNQRERIQTQSSTHKMAIKNGPFFY